MATSILVEHDSLDENRRKIAQRPLYLHVYRKQIWKLPSFYDLFSHQVVLMHLQGEETETLSRTKIFG